MGTVCKKKSWAKESARIILKVIRRQKENGNIKRKETHIYKCPKCEKYHLTSNANWRKKLKKKLKKL